MNRIRFLVIGGICALGLLAGLGVRTFFFPDAMIAVYPSVVEFQHGVLQGESLEVHFTLRNGSRVPATITSVNTTCGCMLLSGAEGPFTTPTKIQPAGTIPLAVSVTTAAQAGQMRYGLVVVSRGPLGSTAETTANIHVNVLATLRADPQSIRFRDAYPGAQLFADVELADVLPEPGVEIGEVRVSNEHTMSVQLIAAEGSSRMFGESVDGRVRGRLRVAYTPDAVEGRIHETITVVPLQSKYPALPIPLYCEMAEAPVRLRPSGLTLSSSSGAFRRSVILESDDPLKSVLVSEQPSGINARVDGSKAHERTLTIEGDAAQLPIDRPSEICLQVDGQELRLPIRLLAD